jgi:3-phenylpropionate/trans-cinnamate dioxygenase ferredoxin reductase component
MEPVVIVGAGLAGHRTAEALRRDGFAGELVLVGDEAHRPYDRPPLSKQVLGGSMPPEECYYPSEADDVTWLLGRTATGLDRTRRIVRLGGGEELSYDALVIATGRRARAWPKLPDLAGFYTLRSLEDSMRLRRAVRPGTRVAIVGAGFIGCEVAATLRGLGVQDVTLIDVAPYPMPALGPEVGKRAIALHESRGVRLRLGTSVAMFEGEERVEAVRLEDGERIDADLVLLALGSQPNSEWLEDSGLELLNGSVLCDEHCFAIGTDDIVAVGDIAAYPHRDAPAALCVEHWTNARDMAAAAARNLIADRAAREPFVAVPTFWSDQYDVKIKSAGFLALADSYVVVEDDPSRPALVVEARRNGTLVGAIVFNRNRTVIQYQRKLADGLLV